MIRETLAALSKSTGQITCHQQIDDLVQSRPVSTSRLPAISPMHPTLVREPFHRGGWIYEEKYDGWQMFAFKDGQRVRLVSRNRRDHTARFAAIAAAVAFLSARDDQRDSSVQLTARALRARGVVRPSES